MLKVEDWAEIRWLDRAEGMPIKETGRRLGVARNTVRAALNSDRPPKCEREPRGQVADAYEAQIPDPRPTRAAGQRPGRTGVGRHRVHQQ